MVTLGRSQDSKMEQRSLISKVSRETDKSWFLLLTHSSVPSLPAFRSSNLRQRGEETPSHPGGLSEIGRQRLEEHRRSRERQRGKLNYLSFVLSPNFDFQQRV